MQALRSPLSVSLVRRKHMGKTKAQDQNDVRVNIEGTMFPYDDAKKDVVLERSLMDIFRGVPGVAGKCMNAQCVMRLKADFPHPVLGVSVLKARVYVIDSPNHVVRYTLSKADSQLIGEHDEKAIGEPGILVLRAPRPSDRKGVKRGSGEHGGSFGPNRGPGKPMHRGEKARVKAAVGALA